MARDYQSKKASRYRKVLELAMADTWQGDRKQLRIIFATLQSLNYNVLGYRAKLETALKYVARAEAAIKALEG